VAGVAAYAGLLSLAMAAANVLLARSRRDSQRGGASLLTTFVARPRALKGAVIVLWSATAVLLAYAGAREYRRSSLVSVRGYVRDAAGRPVPNANVSLSGHPAQEVTDTAGRFEFEKVDRNRATELTASSEGYESEPISWDATKDGSRPAEIRLPTDPPFRVTYMLLRGYAFDLFLSGDDDTYIVQNEVWRHAKTAARQFATEAGNPLVMRTTSVRREPTWHGDVLTNLDSVFAGSMGMPSDARRFGPLQREATQRDLRRVTTDPGWSVFVARAGDQRNLGLRRPATRSDLDAYAGEPYARFMLHVTRESFPPAFGVLTLTTPLIGCDYGGKTATLVLPRAALRVAVLENISPKPLSIRMFRVRENPNAALRDMETEKREISGRKPHSAALVPLEITPGEKVAIPLAMLLVHDEEEIEEFGGPATGAAADVEAVARRWSIAASELRSLRPPRGEAVSANAHYFYGPSMEVERVELREASYPFRRRSTVSTMLKGVAEIGSCPFVMTHSARGWHTEGVVLAGRDEPQKRGTDALRLRQFDGMIVIEEREPETSFLESVVVRAAWPDGTTLVLHPRCGGSCFPAVLRRGNRLVLRFDVPQRRDATFYLVASGYFMEDSTRSKRATGQTALR
jgi:hypothetical protein